MTQAAQLILENGQVFEGISIGAQGSAVGEVVFNTSLVGYQEILTDPSYAGQLITFTYPHIGNIGINDFDAEAAQVAARGVIVRDYCDYPSNWRAQMSLSDYLKAQGIVGISGIDTRALTHILRQEGAQKACVTTEGIDGQAQAAAFAGLKGMDLAKEVTTQSTYEWTQAPWGQTASDFDCHIVAYDFGIKRSILRELVRIGARVTVVPATTSAQDVLALKPDGVFLSNGPGDPEPCTYAIEAIQHFLNVGVPLFGICLGMQLMAIASGARTYKMKFGHHGGNHPVQCLDSKRVMITAQNHGFAVDADLPNSLSLTHQSLFDKTVQGIRHTSAPAFAFQGHPEAGPGPNDAKVLFDAFKALMTQTQFQSAVATQSVV